MCDAILCPSSVACSIVSVRLIRVCDVILCLGTLVYVVLSTCDSNILIELSRYSRRNCMWVPCVYLKYRPLYGCALNSSTSIELTNQSKQS